MKSFLYDLMCACIMAAVLAIPWIAYFDGMKP